MHIYLFHCTNLFCSTQIQLISAQHFFQPKTQFASAQKVFSLAKNIDLSVHKSYLADESLKAFGKIGFHRISWRQTARMFPVWA